MGVPGKKYELIAQAIHDTRSRNHSKVCLQLETIMHQEMLKWDSYVRLSPKSQRNALYRRLERLGICTTDDVKRLINVVSVDMKNIFRQALRM
ncbi:MAG: hypothetical protein A4E56_00177 [Pelotomaculum sp. PtaU1.Bin065]|nr:MAG: hypothetical protein A4E56_00177 [Pelotomaculum sp. PtaU1.Bin065]